MTCAGKKRGTETSKVPTGVGLLVIENLRLTDYGLRTTVSRAQTSVGGWVGYESVSPQKCSVKIFSLRHKQSTLDARGSWGERGGRKGKEKEKGEKEPLVARLANLTSMFRSGYRNCTRHMIGQL